MPELPEVTALVADLDARLSGRTVKRLDVLAFAALKTFDPPATAVNGCVVAGVARHGKFLDIALDGWSGGELHLILHLARAGWIRWRAAAPKTSARPGRAPKNPLAARLLLEPDESGLDITEAGMKKSLALWVVRRPRDVERIETLGPDPLGPRFTVESLRGILAASGRAQIKGVLRDQRVIAGIGNAYSDEILHAARMSPFKPAAMTDAESQRLFDAMQSTLREAIARSEGLAASELKAEKHAGLQVHGRFGEPCPVCGTIIRQVIFADSTLQYCPGCQTGGKILADRVLSRLLK